LRRSGAKLDNFPDAGGGLDGEGIGTVQQGLIVQAGEGAGCHIQPELVPTIKPPDRPSVEVESQRPAAGGLPNRAQRCKAIEGWAAPDQR